MRKSMEFDPSDLYFILLCIYKFIVPDFIKGYFIYF